MQIVPWIACTRVGLLAFAQWRFGTGNVRLIMHSSDAADLTTAFQVSTIVELTAFALQRNFPCFGRFLSCCSGFGACRERSMSKTMNSSFKNINE